MLITHELLFSGLVVKIYERRGSFSCSDILKLSQPGKKCNRGYADSLPIGSDSIHTAKE